MDPSETEVQEVQEEIHDVPESIIMKRKGRPAGAKNKVKESSTGGTPETAQDPMYTSLMKRLDSMDEALKKKEETKPETKPKKPRQPRPRPIVAFKEPIVEEEYHPQPKEKPFHINGSPRTASRQLMEHLHMQQMERASARERMYENFLPL
jgi:hypothetical protein